MYELFPTQESRLFFSMDNEKAERCGVIGHLRGDFDTGKMFYTTWFDNQRHLKNDDFKAEFDRVIKHLRSNSEAPVLKSRSDMATYCYKHPEQFVEGAWHKDTRGFKVVTEQFSYYVRCFPHKGDYNFYVYCYDNRYLLPELEGKHSLPMSCYSVLPTSGELVILDLGESGYTISSGSRPECEVNRSRADYKNWSHGVTRAQEEAMLAGSLFGWDAPAAKPWNYEQDGSPRQQAQPPKRDSLER